MSLCENGCYRKGHVEIDQNGMAFAIRMSKKKIAMVRSDNSIKFHILGSLSTANKNSLNKILPFKIQQSLGIWMINGIPILNQSVFRENGTPMADMDDTVIEEVIQASKRIRKYIKEMCQNLEYYLYGKSTRGLRHINPPEQNNIHYNNHLLDMCHGSIKPLYAHQNYVQLTNHAVTESYRDSSHVVRTHIARDIIGRQKSTLLRCGVKKFCRRRQSELIYLYIGRIL